MAASIETALQIHTTMSSLEDAATSLMEEGTSTTPSNDTTATTTTTGVAIMGGEATKGKDDHAVLGVGSLLLYAVALFAFVSAGVAMYVTQFALVDFACATVLLLSPVAIAQKLELSKLGTLRAHQNELRLAVNTMFLENTRLKNTITALEGDITDLKGVEQDLERTSQKMGAQADRLYQTIQENDVLQTKIQKNLESQVLQNILTAALKYDSNDNFSFDATELKRLKTSISQIPGVALDSTNFDKWIGSAKELNLSEIMRRFRDVMNVETPEDARIVHMTPRKIVQRGFFR